MKKAGKRRLRRLLKRYCGVDDQAATYYYGNQLPRVNARGRAAARMQATFAISDDSRSETAHILRHCPVVQAYITDFRHRDSIAI